MRCLSRLVPRPGAGLHCGLSSARGTFPTFASNGFRLVRYSRPRRPRGRPCPSMKIVLTSRPTPTRKVLTFSCVVRSDIQTHGFDLWSCTLLGLSRSARRGRAFFDNGDIATPSHPSTWEVDRRPRSCFRADGVPSRLAPHVDLQSQVDQLVGKHPIVIRTNNDLIPCSHGSFGRSLLSVGQTTRLRKSRGVNGRTTSFTIGSSRSRTTSTLLASPQNIVL